MASLSDWIGKREHKIDRVSTLLVRRMAATLGVAAPQAGDALPHLWHWMFFQPELLAADLGRDGHPALGGFMPPADGRNRMWAGGSFEFAQPLRVGEAAECVSTIENVVEKLGSTGSLVFVTVRHDYAQAGVHCFTERQNVVYRAPSAPKPHSAAAPAAEWHQPVQPDATLLFRYSALTFNGHRIHYDYPYATEVEGYAGLVVHGPMMATWALHGFMAAHPDKRVLAYEYRGVRPTTLPQAVEIGGRLQSGSEAEVWIANGDGLIQQGKVVFESV